MFRNIETDTVEVSVNASEPLLQMGLQKVLDLYKVPGFSIAVIDVAESYRRKHTV